MTYPTARLDSLCKAVNVGHVGPSSMHRQVDGIPFVMGKDVGVGVIRTDDLDRVTPEFHRSQPKSQVRAGDIVVVRIGKSGQAAKVPASLGEANCSGLVIIKQPRIDPDFLVYFLNSPIGRSYSLAQTRGSTRPTLNTKSVAETFVPNPPLAEQQRIVAILDEAFTGLATATANAEKNLKNARELFESYLSSVFIRGAEEWTKKSLRDVSIEFGRGKSKHRPRNDPALYGGKYPFIQTGDIRNSGGTILEYSQTYNDKGLAQSKRWPKGTICITIAANIAETGILGFDACFPDSVIGIVVDPTQTNNRFVEYLLRFFKAILKAQGKGSAQDNINLATFENRKFPFPPVEVQNELAARLDAMAEEVRYLESTYDTRLGFISELRQSFLQKAFSGELTSPPSQAVKEAAE